MISQWLILTWLRNWLNILSKFLNYTLMGSKFLVNIVIGRVHLKFIKYYRTYSPVFFVIKFKLLVVHILSVNIAPWFTIVVINMFVKDNTQHEIWDIIILQKLHYINWEVVDSVIFSAHRQSNIRSSRTPSHLWKLFRKFSL